MKVITAVEAGKRLGVSERTVRYWIEKGIIQTDRPPMPNGDKRKNRLAIPENEISRILEERQQYEYAQPAEASTSELTTILQRLTILEQEVQSLKQSIATPEKPIAMPTPLTQLIAPQHQPEPHSATQEPVQTISEEMIPLSQFAPDHGLNTRTVSDQIRKGKRGEKLQATENIKATPGKDKWFFSPEQQRLAILYWQHHPTPGFHLCDNCPHDL